METRKLRNRHDTFLQALISTFELHREEDGGLRLKLDLNANTDTIHNPGLRKKVQEQNNKKPTQQSRVKAVLQSFYEDSDILARRFRTEGIDYRFSNAGVLPIIKIDDESYFCLFYRGVFPVGWNIANGGSNNEHELDEPDSILLREFGEELIIADRKKRLRYVYSPADEKAMTGTLDLALRKWRMHGYMVEPLPIKLLDGPDALSVQHPDRLKESRGFFLSLTHEDSAIELDRVAAIQLPEGAALFDGEYESGLLLNRPIGLFRVERLIMQVSTAWNSRSRRKFLPDRLFFSGLEREPGELEIILRDEYFPAHRKKGFRTRKQDIHYRNEKRRFGLCPITRSILARYKTWNERADAIEAVSRIKDKTTKKASKEYNLFISYKHENEEMAFRVEEYFKARGWNPFCSGRSIPEVGESNYRAEIDKALDQSEALIVIATQAEHLSSGWLYYEWSSFLNEINSRRKERANLISLTTDLEISDLPLALRSRQNFSYDKAVPSEAMENLFQFLSSPRDGALQ